MKLSLLKYKTKSYLKRNQTARTNLPWQQGLNIGVIFTVEDKQKHDLIKEFIRKLEHDGKKVTIVCFLPKKKENYEFLFDFFTDEDLSFWGNINSPSASSFANAAFDFLFYIDTKPNALIMNIIAKSKAKCRVGKYEPDSESFFELMIENGMNVGALLDSMYKYASQIR